ncbi:hypothetical protein OROMI_005177 [Orobanche minor]
MESSSSTKRFTSICIFGGASHGSEACFTEAAHNLGRILGEKCMHIVYGEGSLGLMGCAAAFAYMEGVRVLGVIPKPLAKSKIIEATVGDEFRAANMQDHISHMSNNAHDFITLPGGFWHSGGTFSCGFISERAKCIIVVATTPEELIEKSIAFVPEPDPALANIVWTENFSVRKCRVDTFLSL